MPLNIRGGRGIDENGGQRKVWIIGSPKSILPNGYSGVFIMTNSTMGKLGNSGINWADILKYISVAFVITLFLNCSGASEEKENKKLNGWLAGRIICCYQGEAACKCGFTVYQYDQKMIRERGEYKVDLDSKQLTIWTDSVGTFMEPVAPGIYEVWIGCNKISLPSVYGSEELDTRCKPLMMMRVRIARDSISRLNVNMEHESELDIEPPYGDEKYLRMWREDIVPAENEKNGK